MYKSITISPLKLLLDESNPRFLTRQGITKDQESIVNYLVKFEEIKELAAQINSYGGLIPGERILAIKQGEYYIVLEGNRRTTAMKLLLNPNLYASLKSEKNFKNFPVINDQCKQNISRIQIDVVDNRDSANFSLIRRHINGIRKWSPLSKMYFYKNLLEQGKSLNFLVEMSLEKKSDISRLLRGYSILRLILDNYQTYFPNSNYISEVGEAFLDTELIAQRLISFYTKKLNVKFNNTNFQIELPNNNSLKEKLIEILVKIAHLTWEKEVINTRNLNKNEQINSYFTERELNNHDRNELVTLIEDYVQTKATIEITNAISSPNNRDDKLNNNANNHNPQDKDSLIFDEPDKNQINLEESDENQINLEESDENQINSGSLDDNQINLNEPNEKLQQQDSNSRSSQTKGRPRKKPEEYEYLLKSYPFKNKYTKNKRINQILVEMCNVNYKDNTISSMFLIRTLLETYVNDYIDYFASLEHTNTLKLKNLNPNRAKRNKPLRELIFHDIYNHLKNVIQQFPETYELIQATFTDNNTTSTMQIIHFYVHSAETYPERIELLDAWQKISQIIKTLDDILSEMHGQTQ